MNWCITYFTIDEYTYDSQAVKTFLKYVTHNYSTYNEISIQLQKHVYDFALRRHINWPLFHLFYDNNNACKQFRA